jgi:hypothetical protein
MTVYCSLYFRLRVVRFEEAEGSMGREMEERESLYFNIRARMPKCLYIRSDDNQKLISSPVSEILP